MTRVFATILILILTALSTLAGEASAQDDEALYMIVVNGKCGYINRQGEIVIEPQFLIAKDFHEGLAAVGSMGSFGYIDTKGAWAIPARFRSADDFHEGRAKVSVDSDREGIIDREGNWIVTPDCWLASSFSEGRAIIGRIPEGGQLGDVEFFCIDINGNQLFKAEYVYGDFSEGLAPFFDSDLGMPFFPLLVSTGYLDLDGNTVIEPIAGYYGEEFSDGFALLRVSTAGLPFQIKRHCYFIDQTGKLLNKRPFFQRYVRSFSDGLALVGDDLLGYIDTTGEFAIQPRFLDATDFREGRAVVRDEAGLAIIDRTGSVIARPDLPANLIPKDIEAFQNGMAFVSFPETLALVDSELNLREVRGVPPPDAYSDGGFSEGYFVAVDYGGFNEPTKYHVIDSNGRIAGVREVERHGRFHEGLAAFSPRVESDDPAAYYDNPTGYMNPAGEILIEPEFMFAGDFSEGLAYADDEGGKIGYIDRTGEFVIEPAYDWAEDFSEGRAAVQLGNDWGFIDKRGKVIVEPSFEQVQWFSQGLAGVMSGGKWGFVSPKGIMLIQPKYDEVLPFSDGLAAVRLGELWGYIDRTGRMAIEPAYGWALSFSDGLATVYLVRKRAATPEDQVQDEWFFEDMGCRIINKRGNTVLDLGDKWTMNSVTNGLIACSSQDSGWDYYNLKGEKLTDFRLSDAHNFREGISVAGIPQRIAYVDTDGNVVWPPTY